MEHANIVDLVLEELVKTDQPSISVRRVYLKNDLPVEKDSIQPIEEILEAKSLVVKVTRDSKGFKCYRLTDTGQDFLRTYGSYSEYLTGVGKESKQVERVKRKVAYNAKKRTSGTYSAYKPREGSFIEKNFFKLVILAIILSGFYFVFVNS